MARHNSSGNGRFYSVIFVVCFLAVGIPFWSIPYNELNVPNGFFGPGAVVVFVVALLMGLRGKTPFGKTILIPGLAMPAALMARVVVEGVLVDASHHNLWPLALIIAIVFSALVAGGGAVVGVLLSRFGR